MKKKKITRLGEDIKEIFYTKQRELLETNLHIKGEIEDLVHWAKELGKREGRADLQYEINKVLKSRKNLGGEIYYCPACGIPVESNHQLQLHFELRHSDKIVKLTTK